MVGILVAVWLGGVASSGRREGDGRVMLVYVIISLFFLHTCYPVEP